MSKLHRDALKAAFDLVKAGWNAKAACEVLGISRSTLYRYQPYIDYKKSSVG